MKFLNFFYFCGNFCLLDPDPDPDTDPLILLIRIRIRNIARIRLAYFFRESDELCNEPDEAPLEEKFSRYPINIHVFGIF